MPNLAFGDKPILPKEFLDDLGWREKQKLVVERRKGGIFIRDWRTGEKC